MGRKEQIEHKAGSIRDGMISNYAPYSYCLAYEDGYIDGANWSDSNPKDGLVNIDEVCDWLYNNWKGDDFYITDVIEGLRKEYKQ